ncbi:MAG: DUF559 domain-containing protein, partial [Dehalococcoidia bacterium]
MRGETPHPNPPPHGGRGPGRRRPANRPIALARVQRLRPTDAERRLWAALRRRRFDGFKFRRQHAIGPYILDFVCLEARLAVEVDGSFHLERRGHDQVRGRWLVGRGYRVLRFSDRDVLTALSSVEDSIFSVLAEHAEESTPLPGPPPQGGRERCGAATAIR